MTPLSRNISAAAEPLPPLDDPAFGAMFDRWAGRRALLLGEASHGTEEFYRARAAITRHMIVHHGVRVVAVEADWPDAAVVNRHIRHQPRQDEEQPFQRFPTWMWRNRPVAELIAWMRDWNRDRPADDQVGFYGLDLYNMTASIRQVLGYLDKVDTEAAQEARRRYGCLTPWQGEPARYARAALSGYRSCEAAVVEQCAALLARQLDYAAQDAADFLDAAQNARLIAAAEKYYRAMYRGGAASWNLRDTHMAETLIHLLDARQAPAVVWAHNSHVGDARATVMGRRHGEVSLGQLCRERVGNVALLGFGTHDGAVTAAQDWDEPHRTMTINPSRPDSVERLFHDTGCERMLLDLAQAPEGLDTPRLQRFIGVVYRPDTERQSHYMEATLPEQFDGWIWFDRTRPLMPLEDDRVAP